jgi:hypothetical protein
MVGLTSNGSVQRCRGSLVYNDDRRDLGSEQTVRQSSVGGGVKDIQLGPAF